ncbi:phosphoribosylanthranilate isomerase [Candidatus Vidania fulgoroideorum]
MIKICGIKKINDLLILNKFNIKYFGYIFYIKSKNFISNKIYIQNKMLKDIFVVVNKYIKNNNIVQFHGNEENMYLKKIYVFNKNILKVYLFNLNKLRTNFFFNEVNKNIYLNYLFFDYENKQNKYILLNLNFSKKKLILSGKLKFNNIREKIFFFNIFCLDFSSGSESNFFKSKKKIVKLLNNMYENA